jgi:hypothetical protein
MSSIPGFLTANPLLILVRQLLNSNCPTSLVEAAAYREEFR